VRRISKYLSLVVAIATLLILPLAGCSSSSPSPLVESEVRAYADTMTENILQALNGDYILDTGKPQPVGIHSQSGKMGACEHFGIGLLIVSLLLGLDSYWQVLV
jgi:hypothetical protein